MNLTAHEHLIHRTDLKMTKNQKYLQLSERMVVSLYVTTNHRMRCDGRKLVFLHLRHLVPMSPIAVPDFSSTTKLGGRETTSKSEIDCFGW